MRMVEFRYGMLPCAFRFESVPELRLLDFDELQRKALDRVCAMFPNMTSLKIASIAVPLFDEVGAMEYFIRNMSRVDKLSVTTSLLESQFKSMAGMLRWPVRTIELDVSASGNSFARRARSVMRELLTAKSILTIRSTRKRDITGEWKPQYFITIRVGPGDGRQYTFLHDNFARAAQNYIAPLLHAKQVQEVVVDGYAACSLLYVACGIADLAHIKTLRIVASDSDSIYVPQRELRLSALKELVLVKDDARGSRVTAASVEGLVSKLHTDGRVALRLIGVYVYADCDPLNIEQYVDLVEGVIRPPGWCHITPCVV